ncbi:MAG TPA: UDP-3-O-acyl-N-acetylglucosamine deacetylase [Rhizomicrobium sp.]|nr:UDP-3-O-acyl-N-acetylglucosamine deacetylase [Rhizomicrobium sp.]
MSRRTIANPIKTTGVALHSGREITMVLAPAPSGSGIVFRRDDLGVEIPALWDRVAETQLGTVIAQGRNGVAVIEHLMAAVAGAEIDDLLVIVDGGELPILDGDALSYSRMIEQAGIDKQKGARTGFRLRKEIAVESGDASARLVPAQTREFDFEITFATPAIGTQTLQWEFSREGFERDIAPARTFGFIRDLEMLNKKGLARGASFQNTIAIDGDKIVNKSLMRFADEFVRHKILDAVGDLALAGAPLIARFEGRRSGHALNNALLRALFADPQNYDEIFLS